MPNCAVVGINWGDEGKGRMVDLLTKEFDIVIRYQGGGNAGHTVVNEYGEFALHLLPSGIFHKGIVNILGNDVAVDPENLCKEIDLLASKGISLTPDDLKISDRASLLMPWHRDLDALEERRLRDRKFGSTIQGIAPFYSDKYQKKTIQAGEVFFPELLYERLKDLCEWKNLIIDKVYGGTTYTIELMKEWCDEYLERIKPYICDVTEYLNDAQKQGKRILFEAQLGALRDIDFGIYPYTTSSNTLASYAPIGSGCPWMKIDQTIGIVKAYSTCVGEGPFVSELFGTEAEKLREEGKEYGAKTGRARRVGALDLVATKYGVKMQGATELALTKLDILSYLKKIPVCVKYKIDGMETDRFPFPSLLNKAEPVIRYHDGWECDISKIRKWEDLPEQAKNYVKLIEDYSGCRIRYISVGPQREAYIER